MGIILGDINQNKIYDKEKVLNNLDNQYNISKKNLNYILEETDIIFMDENINLIEFGSFLIKIVPQLIILIRDTKGTNKIDGKVREKILIDVLCYIIVKHINTDTDYYTNLTRKLSPVIIELAFKNPYILKYKNTCFFFNKKLFNC